MHKTIVLDLDETLVHNSLSKPDIFDFRVIGYDENTYNAQTVYVKKRPYVEEFLKELSNYYNIVVFTSSIQGYADPVLDVLDPCKYISKRYYRQHCTKYKGNFTKDLTLLDKKPEDCFIIDNSPISFILNPDRAILCSTWLGDRNDKELKNVLPFLKKLSKLDDVRRGIKNPGIVWNN